MPPRTNMENLATRAQGTDGMDNAHTQHQAKMKEQEESRGEVAQANRILQESIALGFTILMSWKKDSQGSGHTAWNPAQAAYQLQGIA